MRVLLDTSFLLPSVGVQVAGTGEVLKKLKEEGNEFYYSNFNLLEILWVLISLERRGVRINMQAVETGLRSIAHSYRRAMEEVGIFPQALDLRRAGHTDMIDCLLYAISLKEDLTFLTFDFELREFLSTKGFKDVLLIP